MLGIFLACMLGIFLACVLGTFQACMLGVPTGEFEGAEPPQDLQGVWGAQPPRIQGVWGAKPPRIQGGLPIGPIGPYKGPIRALIGPWIGL